MSEIKKQTMVFNGRPYEVRTLEAETDDSRLVIDGVEVEHDDMEVNYVFKTGMVAEDLWPRLNAIFRDIETLVITVKTKPNAEETDLE